MADGSGQRVESSSSAPIGFAQVLDEVTLQRARRGDTAAFAAIYDRYGLACYNLALRILGEPSAAQDIVHDVFVRLITGLRGFRGEAPFGAWLKRMVANATIDALRGRQRFVDVDDDALATFAAVTEDAEDRADAWSLLMRLPPRARAVVVLHEVEGYTHKELAQWFGQSESYSKSILARALAQLQARTRETTGGKHDDD